MKNTSAKKLWNDYLGTQGLVHLQNVPKISYFSTTEKEANTCAKWVKKGIKKATTAALLTLQNKNEKLPKIGDFIIVTNWDGDAICLVQLTKVSLKPFFSIDEAYANLEGFKSLSEWKSMHYQHFSEELDSFNRKANETMILVCQEFVKVYEG